MKDEEDTKQCLTTENKQLIVPLKRDGSVVNMRLDAENDLALKSLMALTVLNKRLSIAQIADIYGIERHRIVRCFASLRNLNLIQTTRGTGGGTELQKPADCITLADIIFGIEPSFILTPDMEDKSRALLPDCLSTAKLYRTLEVMRQDLAKTTVQELADYPPARSSIIEAAKKLGYIEQDFE